MLIHGLFHGEKERKKERKKEERLGPCNSASALVPFPNIISSTELADSLL